MWSAANRRLLHRRARLVRSLSCPTLGVARDSVHPSKIDPDWPNPLRWFLCQELVHFTPWHFFTEPDELGFAAEAFAREDVDRGQVLVFARRQDCDDFAGIELQGGKPTNRVVCFHPVFASGVSKSPRTWNIVSETFDDVFDFVAKRVVGDMKAWASVEDAKDFDRNA